MLVGMVANGLSVGHSQRFYFRRAVWIEFQVNVITCLCCIANSECEQNCKHVLSHSLFFKSFAFRRSKYTKSLSLENFFLYFLHSHLHRQSSSLFFLF